MRTYRITPKLVCKTRSESVSDIVDSMGIHEVRQVRFVPAKKSSFAITLACITFRERKNKYWKTNTRTESSSHILFSYYVINICSSKNIFISFIFIVSYYGNY